MTFGIVQLILIQLILPIIFIGMIIKTSYVSRLQWLLQVLAVTMFLIWIFLTGRWDWFSYYLRYVWMILLIVGIYLSWRKNQDIPLWKPLDRKQWFSTGVDILLLIVFGLYTVQALSSFSTSDEGMDLIFPLKEGSFYVAHGGSNTSTNYHSVYEPQQYALDIVALNKFGARAKGLYPKNLEAYEIYGADLLSPCSGEIIETRNHFPDFIPPETDREHPEGNYVAIVCDGYEATLYIAHMQEGSITFESGDKVEVGDLLGRVGNSGNTSEPHLHIHAELDGKGVPLRFDGKFLMRNNVVR